MRRPRLLRGRRPRRDDEQGAVDVHGIGVDDHTAESLGERQRQRRLAARRRTCNEDRLRHVVDRLHVPLTGSHGMFYVATLISHPDRPAVTEILAQKAARYLPHGRPLGWLDPGIAIDIPFLID